MGIMIKEGKPITQYFIDSNGDLSSKKSGYFKNHDAVSNLLRYITRTRFNEDRRHELICWGAIGVSGYDPIDNAIMQMCSVQNVQRDRICRRMYHFVYSPDHNECAKIGQNYVLVNNIAWNQANFFYQNGFQVVYAIHYDPKRHLHFHFAVNSVNFHTGLMYHFLKGVCMEYTNLMSSISYRILNLPIPTDVFTMKRVCSEE